VCRWSQHRIILETLRNVLLPNITKLQAHVFVFVVVVVVVVAAAAVAAAAAAVIFERTQ